MNDKDKLRKIFKQRIFVGAFSIFLFILSIVQMSLTHLFDEGPWYVILGFMIPALFFFGIGLYFIITGIKNIIAVKNGTFKPITREIRVNEVNYLNQKPVTTIIKNCPICGAPLDETDYFCRHCGAKIER